MTLSGRTANHPGEQLAERLEALELSAPELRRRLQVRVKRLGQIVTGQRAISGDTALRLGHFFGASRQFWLNLQVAFDLRVAEQKTGATIKRLPTLAV